jgi:hypothetical protein
MHTSHPPKPGFIFFPSKIGKKPFKIFYFDHSYRFEQIPAYRLWFQWIDQLSKMSFSTQHDPWAHLYDDEEESDGVDDENKKPEPTLSCFQIRFQMQRFLARRFTRTGKTPTCRQKKNVIHFFCVLCVSRPRRYAINRIGEFGIR